jgi:hypothetical protein
VRHLNTPECPRCNAILKDAHPDLQAFARELRKDNPDAHVSWAFRGEAEQNAFKAKGTSNATFGNSPHNFKPALALDWFRLTHTGAHWDRPWFEFVLAPATRAFGLEWGGDWNGNGKRDKNDWDAAHVQLPNWRDLK